MADYQFDKGIGFWVLSAANVLERAANEALAPHGITFRQVQVLGCLAHVGEISQAELAERIQVEPSTIVRILDRMERDGWVERISSPNDRRVKHIRITSNVAPVWKTITECGERIRQQATEGLQEADVAHLIATLQRICSNFGDEN